MKKRTQSKPKSSVPKILDAESSRRRRQKRWIVIGSILAALPVLELIAYQWRAVTVTIVNRSEGPMHGLKVAYPGGSFEQDELKSGGTMTRLIRPDYTFGRDDFSTYRTTIRFGTGDGRLSRHNIRIQSLDYSAGETYSVRPGPPGLGVEVEHMTEPGFPLGTIRSLFRSLGLG